MRKRTIAALVAGTGLVGSALAQGPVAPTAVEFADGLKTELFTYLLPAFTAMISITVIFWAAGVIRRSFKSRRTL